MPGYYAAEPNSYLVITGLNVDGIKIKKKAFKYPFQKITKISITPFDFSMNLQAMTVEKLKFSLPAVFTIGPHDTPESLRKYATLLTGNADGAPPQLAKSRNSSAIGTDRNVVQNIVKGIIEGETRSIVSTMTLEELFRERKIFKHKVIENVQTELEAFGLHIYNANVRELQDAPGSEYFSYLSQKAHEGALNQAKIDVADARAKGEIGEAEKQSRAKQEVAKIDATTAILQTERKGQQMEADAKLKQQKINVDNALELERIRAKRTEESRDAHLLKDVEMKRADMELEKQRATTVVSAKIARESAEEKAQAALYTQQRSADASRYQQQAEAEASYTRKAKDTDAQRYDAVQLAEANAIAKRQAADAAFYAQQAEAKGIHEMAKAYAELANVMGGPQGLMNYLMLRDGLQVKLAEANAKAIHGLQPKIHVWSNGSDPSTVSDPIRNIYQNLPPLFDTLREQTGMQPPSWLVSMPQDGQAQDNYQKQLVKGKAGAKVNGE